MIFAPQAILLGCTSERCTQGWKVPIGAHKSILSVCTMVKMISSFKYQYCYKYNGRQIIWNTMLRIRLFVCSYIINIMNNTRLID